MVKLIRKCIVLLTFQMDCLTWGCPFRFLGCNSNNFPTGIFCGSLGLTSVKRTSACSRIPFLENIKENEKEEVDIIQLWSREHQMGIIMPEKKMLLSGQILKVGNLWTKEDSK